MLGIPKDIVKGIPPIDFETLEIVDQVQKIADESAYESLMARKSGNSAIFPARPNFEPRLSLFRNPVNSRFTGFYICQLSSACRRVCESFSVNEIS